MIYDDGYLYEYDPDECPDCGCVDCVCEDEGWEWEVDEDDLP